MIPWIDPAAATRVTIKQKPLRILTPIQTRENLGTLACTRYISVGKYTVKGKKEIAPSKPTMLLKKGSIIATTAVKITYTVLHIILNPLNLNLPTRYSFPMKLLSGQRFATQVSTSWKTGCVNTCIHTKCKFII